MIMLKDGVRFKMLTPAVIKILDALNQLALEGYVIVLTSADDSVHSPHSKHYEGLAIDFRSHDFTKIQKVKVQDALTLLLGPKFTILLENEGKPKEHFHVQVKIGCSYP